MYIIEKWPVTVLHRSDVRELMLEVRSQILTEDRVLDSHSTYNWDILNMIVSKWFILINGQSVLGWGVLLLVHRLTTGAQSVLGLRRRVTILKTLVSCAQYWLGWSRATGCRDDGRVEHMGRVVVSTGSIGHQL